MKQLLILILATCVSAASHAHPGSGIAVGPDGVIYFADVGRTTIWRMEPGGEPEPFIENRWTHSLTVADNGDLYYEREHANGGVAPASFWRMGADGEHVMLIPPQPDRREFSGDVFALDPSGNVYYPHSVRGEDGGWRVVMMKRTPDGVVSEFTGLGGGPLFTDGAADEATIRIVTAMVPGPDGSVYFTDRHHVRRFETAGADAGRVTTVASGLIDANPRNPPERRGPSTTINRLYGLCVLDDGTVFVAYKAGRRVTRISADGSTSTFYSSPNRWSPLGVAAHGGDVFVLEVSDQSIEDLRVLRVSSDGVLEVIATLH